MKLKLVCIVLALAACLLAQTPTPVPTTVTPPTAISVVGEFNQLASPRFAVGLSALYTTSAQSGIGMFNTSTADVVPVKAVNPANGKSFYAISASFRQGVHERVLATGPFVFLLGADVGPGFSSEPAGGITVSATGSFVATTVYKVNNFMSVVVPIRMLYVQNVGWNPVIQVGVSFNLKNLPAAK